MLPASRFAFLLLTVAPLVGCDDQSKCGPYTDDEGVEHAGCAAQENEEPVVLCDGSSSLKFIGRSSGGNLSGVPSVVSEVGHWSFLLVDGNCQYWTMLEPRGPIRTGTLDPSQEADFSTALRLGAWTANDSKETTGCFDAGTTQLLFADKGVSVYCAATDLTRAYGTWLESLHETGARLSGDVRYTVTDASLASWVFDAANIASAWPLEGPPSVTLESGADEIAEPAIASAEDAEALRDARDAYLTRAASAGSWLRIPMVLEVAGDDARYFDVAMRDVTPFERDGELRADEFFAP